MKITILSLIITCLMMSTIFYSCKEEPKDNNESSVNKTTNVKGEILSIITLPTNNASSPIGSMSWSVDSASSSNYHITVLPDRILFIADSAGLYIVKGRDANKTNKYLINLTGNKEDYLSKPVRVLDYSPAPGQHVNMLPKYEEGDTQETINEKATNSLNEKTEMITLGGWGGSVTIACGHSILNVPGKCDFRVVGNTFASPDSHFKGGKVFSGACEPGYILVAYDKNSNGIPDDDEWYEIEGSANKSASAEPWYERFQQKGNDVNTYRDYKMVYFKPSQEIGSSTTPNVSIDNYIRWYDNKGNKGYKVKNSFHQQSYYPKWVTTDSIKKQGIRLAENGYNEGSNDSPYYVLYAFRYGYVDNMPDNKDASAIDISWAVDKNGNKVDIPGIDFIKVVSAVNQENGWIGECSTEVTRLEDLHLIGTDIESQTLVN